MSRELNDFFSLHLRDRQLAVDALSDELDLRAFLKLRKQRIVRDLEDHGHRRHFKRLQLLMDQRDLLRLCVDLLDGTIREFLRERAGCGGKGDRGGDTNLDNGFHL